MYRLLVFNRLLPRHRPNVKQLCVVDMFAETIRRVLENKSISDQYIILRASTQRKPRDGVNPVNPFSITFIEYSI